MRFRRLDLIAFGHFTDVSLDLSAGDRGLHVIYGLNESGKSTCLRAIETLLYGFGHKTDDGYVHPYNQLRVGGVLEDESGEAHEWVRKKGRSGTLLLPDGRGKGDEERLAKMLGGVDRETFLRQFGLDHPALVAGGREIIAGGGDLGQALFASGAGLSHLREAQRRLESQAGELFKPRASTPRIAALLRRLKELRDEIRGVELTTRAYDQLCERCDRVADQAQEAGEAVAELKNQLARLQAYQEALPLLAERCQVTDSLAPLTDVPRLDDDFIRRRRDAAQGYELAHSLRQRFQSEQKTLEDRLAQLPEQSPLLEHETAIESLLRKLGAHEKAVEDRHRRQTELKEGERRIKGLLAELGRPLELSQLDRLRIPAPQRRRINDLADRRSGLYAALEETENAAAQCEAELRQATERLEAFPLPADCTPLEETLRKIGDPHSWVQAAHKAAVAARRATERVEQQAARLMGTSASPEAVVRLIPPSEATLARLATPWNAAQQKHQRAAELLSELQQRQTHLRGELLQLCAAASVPCSEELDALREARNAHFEDLIAQWSAGNSPQDPQTAPVLERYRRQRQEADQYADRMRLEAEQVARRAHLEASLQRLTEELRCQKQQLREAEEAVEAARVDWETPWKTLGVEPRGPEEMRQWLRDHQTLLEWDEQRKSAEEERQQAEQQLAQLDRQLTTTLAAMSNVDVSRDAAPRDLAATFVALVAQATSQLRAARAKRDQHAELQGIVERLRDQLPGERRRREQAQGQLQQWMRQWAEATATLSLGQEATPTEVREVLERIEAVFAAQHECDSLSDRISKMEEDAAVFQRLVRSVAAEVATDLLQTPPVEAVQKLAERLKQARSEQQKRLDLQKQEEEVRSKLEEAAAEAQQHEQQLEQLGREARCDDPALLPQLEQSSAERIRMEERLGQIDHQLQRLCGGRSLDQLCEEAQQHEPNELEMAIQRTAEEVQRAEQEKEQLFVELGSARGELRRMDGSGRAAQLNQEVESARAELSRLSADYARLSLASLALQIAIDRYRQRSQGPVMRRAEAIFRRLTCDDYGELKIEEDEAGTLVLHGVRSDNGRSVPAAQMSDGTADQLYLALRLASLEEHLTRHPPLPLIVDDLLIQFDDRRSAATLEVLAELSDRTQILFFTHHAHLERLASDRRLADEPSEREQIFFHRLGAEPAWTT